MFNSDFPLVFTFSSSSFKFFHFLLHQLIKFHLCSSLLIDNMKIKLVLKVPRKFNISGNFFSSRLKPHFYNFVLSHSSRRKPSSSLCLRQIHSCGSHFGKNVSQSKPAGYPAYPQMGGIGAAIRRRFPRPRRSPARQIRTCGHPSQRFIHGTDNGKSGSFYRSALDDQLPAQKFAAQRLSCLPAHQQRFPIV